MRARSTLTALFDNNGDEAVINEDPLAGLQDLGDVLVVHPEVVLGALLFEGVVGDDLDRRAFLQGELKTTIIALQDSSPDLRTFGVQGDRQ